MLRILLVFLVTLLLSSTAYCRSEKYDIAYIWDDNMETVLDYQDELENLLGPEESAHLRIVGRRDGKFGIIYELDGSALTSAQLMVKHGELLRKAGLSECIVIDDDDYYRLFNVSYGLGPNLEALKKRYSVIYNYLGEDVGKDLFIEKTGGDNYTLIYRRHGSRESSYTVARRHGRLLKRKGIRTSITPENNNPVIFGESSHLDDTSNQDVVQAPPEKKEDRAEKTKVVAEPQRHIVVELRAVPKKKRSETAYAAGTSLQLAAETTVEKNIEELIGRLRRQGLLDADESTGWMVYDLTTGKSIVDINADHAFQAASMIKPFVALAFFHQVKQGRLIYGPKSRRKMELMIQRSNNAATNWVMRYAGGPSNCEKILKREYGHIFKDTRIVEYIPAGGRTYRNRAIPSDYVRFLQALWQNRLPYGKEMRRLMSLPGRDRLYNGTPIPRGTLVYNKTGSTAHLCGDMGILVPRDSKGRRYPYALVGIIERASRPKNYGRWMLTRGNVIRKVSTLVYKEMKKQYRLL